MNEHQTAPKYFYDEIRERCDLAVAYAEDGAYWSAARILRELALEVIQHAIRVHGPEPKKDKQ